MKVRNLINLLLLGMVTASLTESCVSDLIHDYWEGSYEEGKETTISLKVNIPEMNVATRSDIGDDVASKVTSLWVGIFSAKTGKCTYAKLYTEGTNLPSGHHNFKELTIPTVSGLSYIVAVANPEGNSGYLYNSDGAIEAKPLTELLPQSTDETFTWDDYKNIAISRRSLTNIIDDPMGNLVMSGIYYDVREGDHPNPTPAGWETLNQYENPTYIPASSSTGSKVIVMPGAIHLRRAISHVTFNIKVANYNQENTFKQGRRIISAVPKSYRVVNAPYTSWLHERNTLNGDYQPNPEANAGDVVKVSAITYDDASLPHKANYRASTTYRGNQFITGSEDDGYQFDFWMLENKRWAVSNLGTGDDAYYKREKEQKVEDLTDPNDLDKVKNTGIYTALCGSGEETMNNCATFVEIRCKVNYTDAGLDALHEENGQYNDVIVRTADVIYTVHLGGVKNTDGNFDWNDFAHRRNHKYTYNVTVVDVDRVIVEANAEEGRPDIEGVVNDVTEPAFELDAHYGVFNIQLSNKERTGGLGTQYDENGFPFRIEVYDRNNNPIIIDQNNVREYNSKTNEGKPEYYWTWVEFRPTTGPDVLAEYKPYYKKDADGNDTNERYTDADGNYTTFRLNEIADIEKYPGNNGSKDINEEEQQWYTVFINEYTYETSTTGEVYNNWVYYVNKDPRVCWLNTSNKISNDKESVYIRSKYTVIQKSIQSFYDIRGINVTDVNIDAIGLEHWNEVYGLTLRWEEGLWYMNDLDMNNGKANQRQYLRKGGETTNIYEWNDYFDQKSLQVINEINENSIQYRNPYDPDHAGLKNGQKYYVPNIRYYIDNSFMNETVNGNNFGQAHNPNVRRGLSVMRACMNRNRDNNGDGMIDRSEIRWYLPSSGEMVDLVNGRNSLETPLMDYVSNPTLNTPPKFNGDYSPHHANLRFHYASSNFRLLWAEEGITINHTNNKMSEWNKMGWQVRCARALGTNLRDADPTLTPAFTTDNDARPTKIYPTYFESKTLRDPLTEIPPHQETSTYNRISVTGFEFQPQFISNKWPSGNNGSNGQTYYTNYPGRYQYNGNAANSALLTNHDAAINEANNLCVTNFGPGWRLPNIKEAAVIKVALNNAGLNYNGNPGDAGTCLVNGYEIGNYFACTYREYGVGPDGLPNNDYENRKTKTGYYLGILYEGQGTNPQGHLGRAQCLTEPLPVYYVRCVRDLQ